MIVFPGAKINLGLRITAKRPDGYHDIVTVMVPIGWSDILEVVPAPDGVTTLTCTGRKVDCPIDKNLVMKAYRALAASTSTAAASIYLHKIVPDGAGLGGGSADASATLLAASDLCSDRPSDDALHAIASSMGADCPFFLHHTPMLCTGTGTTMRPVDISFDGLTLLVAKPHGVLVPTAEAYAGVKPQPTDTDLVASLSLPPSQWEQAGVVNDFEPSVFARHPIIAQVKASMLAAGADYAAMTGSGAAVIGVFTDATAAAVAQAALPCPCDTWRELMH